MGISTSIREILIALTSTKILYFLLFLTIIAAYLVISFMAYNVFWTYDVLIVGLTSTPTPNFTLCPHLSRFNEQAQNGVTE